MPCTSWRDCLLRLLSLVREPKAEDEEWEGVVGRIELNIVFEHFNDSSLYLSLTQTLEEQLSLIKEKSAASEEVVRDITRDIRTLDTAKRNVVGSVTALRRLGMLGESLLFDEGIQKPSEESLLISDSTAFFIRSNKWLL